MGFKDAENSAKEIVFQAQKLGFAEGWMATLNAIGLPKTSLFRDVDRISLPKDLPIEAQAQEQLKDNNEEEEADSPSMMELSWQIDSHVVVLDEENPTTSVPTEMQGAAQPRVELTPPVTSEIHSTNPIVPQDPTV
ncbi:hypothetical protein SO802_012449 [Lithocarpus litseifolius]|uniref:Uncharacterized protein n=1 Tax=Lithocarpus litseifolius TaxID=425828 RepID=A0AAW2D5A1_9ROSI